MAARCLINLIWLVVKSVIQHFPWREAKNEAEQREREGGFKNKSSAAAATTAASIQAE